MAYKVKTILLKDSPETTYIQNYTEGLAFVSEWKYRDGWIDFMRYNVAIDSDGNVYFKDGDSIKKYTEAGESVISTTKAILYSISIAGDEYVYYLRKVGSNYFVGRLDASDLSNAGDPCTLTPGKTYIGLVFEDIDEFYIFNRTDRKIEKWNRTTGKIKEMSIGTYFDADYIAFAGDNLMGGRYSQYWTTNKDLESSVIDYEIESGVGEEYVYTTCLCISSIDEEYFLMVYKAGFLAKPIKRYIRRYDSIGNVISTTLIDTSELNIVVFTKSEIPELPITDVSGKASISTSVDIILVKNPLINIKATKLAGRCILYGEILESEIAKIVERGFEYRIQDNEPEIEDTGIEVKEENEAGFEIGEYYLSSWDTYDDLYCAEEDIIWWFRAYLKDENGNKHIAKTWMKNVPTMITSECTDTTSFSTKGHGELIDAGANIVTERGFHVIKEFSGSIFDINEYTYHGFIILSMSSVAQFAPNGILTGWLWIGELLKVVSTENVYGYDLEEYELGIGTSMFDSLPSNSIYKVKAFGKNQLGRGFGIEVNIHTYQMLVDDGGATSSTTKVETIQVMNVPDRYKVTRVGVRWGRTSSCNEGEVYEDGEWENGDSITLLKTDLIPDTKYHSKLYYILEKIETEPEVKNVSGKVDIISYISMFLSDGPLKNVSGKANINSSIWVWWLWKESSFNTSEEPDFPDYEIPLSDLAGIDYMSIIKEIKCNIIADQSIIDKYGRRRTLIIKNNLIQTKEFCISIRDDYLIKFQELKLKIDIDYDIPLPFEREDTILLAYGQINYKTDGNGIIGAKADGEGIVNGQMSILTKIRKININAKAEEAILTLELEV